jgi:hypothetical protein
MKKGEKIHTENEGWVVIALRNSDKPWAGRSGDRISVGAKFTAPLQAGRAAQPASGTMGNGSFPGDRGVEQPFLLAPRLKKE